MNVKLVVGAAIGIVIAALVALLIRAELRADEEERDKKKALARHDVVQAASNGWQQRNELSQSKLHALSERCQAMYRAGYERPLLPSDWQNAKDFDAGLLADWMVVVTETAIAEWRKANVRIVLEWAKPDEYRYSTAKQKVGMTVVRVKPVTKDGREAVFSVIGLEADVDKVWKELQF